MIATREECVIGTSRNGRSIEAVRFSPASYATPKPTAVLFGAIHGDEPTTALMLERLADELVERPPGREVWIVPCLNPDGVATGTKNNAADVDLNRSFASANWTREHRAGYFPGDRPESEPEVQALTGLIARTNATRLISVHATFRLINWDGQGRRLAEAMSALCDGYPAAADIGYPTPGSFGSKYGVDLDLEVVTVEVPYLDVDERSWTDLRVALRWAVDLPS